MSKFLDDLRQLLAPSVAVLQGTIQTVTSNTLLISSPNGPKTFNVANPGAYQPGNKVRFQGEVFLGKVADEGSIPHYSV